MQFIFVTLLMHAQWHRRSSFITSWMYQNVPNYSKICNILQSGMPYYPDYKSVFWDPKFSLKNDHNLYNGHKIYVFQIVQWKKKNGECMPYKRKIVTFLEVLENEIRCSLYLYSRNHRPRSARNLKKLQVVPIFNHY